MRSEDFFFQTENINCDQKNSLKWVESSFNVEANVLGDHQSEYLSLSLNSGMLKLILSLICLGLAILISKTFYLQVVKGNYYFSLAENNRIKVDYVKAQRGIIFDRNYKPMVQNIFGFSLLITQSALPKDETQKANVLDRVAEIFAVNVDDIKTILEKDKKYYFQPITVLSGIDYEKAMAFQIESSELPGVDLDTDFWRKYMDSESVAHLMGYVGKIDAEEYEKDSENYFFSDNIGKTGLEKNYEKVLRGQNGEKKVEVDALGREKKIISEAKYVPGTHLLLSIDSGLQKKSYEILNKKLGNKKAGSVIISNPQTGEILALVDYPSYDGNLFSQGISVNDYKSLTENPLKPLYFRSVLGEYPSGSTVKIVMSAAALQEKIITQDTSFNSNGGIRVGQWFFPDWKAGGHGITNVTKAIAQSVNTFYYYIGGGFGDFKGMGVETIDKYLNLFGLGEKTGIDLPSERKGFVPTEAWKNKVKNEPWYVGDTYHLAIGQGDLLVTPLQVNSYTAAIANGGKLLKPHLVKSFIAPDGKETVVSSSIIRSGMVDEDNIEIVRQGMRETIISGSARSLSVLPVTAGGKTGTAQWNSNKMNHAWFTGFAPFDNPNFCITVLVEEGGEGSSIAVPIAKEIMEYWFGADKETTNT